MAPRVGARVWARRVAEGAAVVTAFAALLVWCSIPDVAYLARENPGTTAFIELRRREAEDAGKPWKLEWRWMPLAKISPYLRNAVVYAEDINFWHHDGVDWNAVEKAAEGDFARGGSTITQQVAKNLYLSPSRSVVRKVRELLITFRLEDDLDKQRILELYLNIAEWGDGVFGAEAAARHWFHRSAASLTAAEAARLAVALPNPRERSPAARSADLLEKSDRILRWMRKDGVISAGQLEGARIELGIAKAPQPAPQPDVEPDVAPESSPAGP